MILHAGIQIHRPQVVQFSVAIVSFVCKVLDFVQLGGLNLTVGSTVFELWLGL